MEWWFFVLLFFGALLLFFTAGIPVALSFMAMDIIGLYFLFGAKGMTVLTNSMIDSVGNFNMSPLPMFVFLGELFFQSRVVDIAFEAIDKWIGGVRARLHIVALIFATIYGAISGSGMAMAAVMGAGLLPEMLSRGYDKKLSLGVIMGGAALDPLIPPSAAAVIIASLANISVGKLLITGTGPGLLYAAMFIAYVLIIVKIKPELAPAYVTKSTFREKAFSLVQMMPFAAIIFLVLGIMMLGIATPTESAAVGAIAALIFAAVMKRLTLNMVRNALKTTVLVSAMMLFIIAGSKAFGQILAMSGATTNVVAIVNDMHLTPIVLFIVLQLIPMILGCFIDRISIFLLTIPLYAPLIEAAHIDPLWFWTLYLVNTVLGSIMPPLGIFLFTLTGAAKDTSLKEVYAASWPFVILIVIGMVLMIAFPGLATWTGRFY